MQLAATAPTDLRADRLVARADVRTSRAEAAAPATTAPLRDAAATPRGTPGLRTGLAAVGTRSLHTRVAGAQQSRDYLDRLDTQLQGLKTQLGSQIAGTPVGDTLLENRRQAVARLWNARDAASAGHLDNTLQFNADAAPRQRFQIRGLDAAALRSGERETLVFSVGSAPRQALTVAIDPALSSAAQLGRINQALGPAGIAAGIDAQGTLSFSVPAADWPQVQATLLVKGGGQRLPTGQFNRVALDTPPPALAPESWQWQDTAATRQTLQQVVRAQQRTAQARASVEETLDQARTQLQAASSADNAAWATQAAEGFAALAQGADYAALAALGPALHGVARTRVERLLQAAA